MRNFAVLLLACAAAGCGDTLLSVGGNCGIAVVGTAAGSSVVWRIDTTEARYRGVRCDVSINSTLQPGPVLMGDVLGVVSGDVVAVFNCSEACSAPTGGTIP